MGRIFGLLMLVIGVWVAAEVYTEGVAGAFGGRLAFLAEDGSGPADTRSTPARVHDKVSSAHAEADARRERLLAE
jgi:hypothetical protein